MLPEKLAHPVHFGSRVLTKAQRSEGRSHVHGQAIMHVICLLKRHARGCDRKHPLCSQVCHGSKTRASALAVVGKIDKSPNPIGHPGWGHSGDCSPRKGEEAQPALFKTSRTVLVLCNSGLQAGRWVIHLCLDEGGIGNGFWLCTQEGLQAGVQFRIFDTSYGLSTSQNWHSGWWEQILALNKQHSYRSMS